MNDPLHVTAAPAARAPLLSPRVLVALALFSLYLIWGSTYLAIRVGLESFPPFTMAAIRFVLTGVAMYAFLRWRGTPAPTALQWRNCAITGTLLLGFGNGLVCYAEQSVSSGLAAVAVACMPLFAAVFGVFFGHWPRRLEAVGLLIGFAGVVVLNFGGDLRGSPIGAAALIAAASAWAFGSLWSKRQDMPGAMMNTAAQMLTGGVALSAFAVLGGEHLPSAVSLRSLIALAYLAVFGSLIAFAAYLYLLKTVRPALATSYAYVNPPVAVLFGVVMGGEIVHALDLAGMAVILTGVAIIALAREAKAG